MKNVNKLTQAKFKQHVLKMKKLVIDEPFGTVRNNISDKVWKEVNNQLFYYLTVNRLLHDNC